MEKNVSGVLGARIRAVRKKRELSQDQLAEKLDTTRTYISKVERGIVNIGVDRLVDFCAVLNVTSMDLLNEKELPDNADVHDSLQKLLKQGSSNDLKLIYKVARAIIL